MRLFSWESYNVFLNGYYKCLGPLNAECTKYTPWLPSSRTGRKNCIIFRSIPGNNLTNFFWTLRFWILRLLGTRPQICRKISSIAPNAMKEICRWLCRNWAELPQLPFTFVSGARRSYWLLPLLCRLISGKKESALEKHRMSTLRWASTSIQYRLPRKT